MGISIELILTSTVKASTSFNSQISNPRIDLTPWDLQLLLVDPIQKGLLFHKPKTLQTQIQHLKASLSRTLDFFPPLSGRLAAVQHEDNTSSFYIDCNNAGALFVHAKADGVTLSDVNDAVYVPRDLVRSFFPLNGVKNYEGTTEPLLAVQVTELVDGVFIGCTVNHTVGDGTSFWHFLNSWSEISRVDVRFGFPSKPPVLHRWVVNGAHNNNNNPIRIPFPNARKVFDDDLNDIPLQKERVFHFSKEKIAQLKAKANVDVFENNLNKISSLQALLAHLWRAIIRGGGSSDRDLNEESCYRLLIGARPRLSPELPQQYFGNAVQAGTVRMKARDVLERGLGFVAWEMNKMVASHTQETLRNFLECWVKEPKLLTEDNMASKALVTSSSPWFDVYGNDFGWGRPVGVRSGAGNKSHGKITVFAGAEDGSIDIEACLLAETLEAMTKDGEFMDAVTV